MPAHLWQAYSPPWPRRLSRLTVRSPPPAGSGTRAGSGGEFPDGAAREGRRRDGRFPHPFTRPLEVPALRPPPLRHLFLPSPHLSLPPSATAAAAATFASPSQRSPPPRPPPRGRHLCGGLGGAVRGQLTPARSAPARSTRAAGGQLPERGAGSGLWAGRAGH